jgi:hypothetical protein
VEELLDGKLREEVRWRIATKGTKGSGRRHHFRATPRGEDGGVLGVFGGRRG